MHLSRGPQRAVAGLALAIAVGHAWCLLPLPSVEAEAAVASAIAKGAMLTQSHREELVQSLYSTFLLDRALDTLLSVAAGIAGISLLRRQHVFAARAALVYSAILFMYAVIASDVAAWGVGSVLSVQASRLNLLIAGGHFELLLGYLFRAVSIVTGLVSLPVAIWYLVKERLGQSGPTSN